MQIRSRGPSILVLLEDPRASEVYRHPPRAPKKATGPPFEVSKPQTQNPKPPTKNSEGDYKGIANQGLIENTFQQAVLQEAYAYGHRTTLRAVWT